MNEKQLLQSAKDIQDAFEALGIMLQVLSIIISDKLVTFVASLDPSKTFTQAKRLEAEVARALDLDKVNIKRSGSSILIEVPHNEVIDVPTFAEVLASYKMAGEAVATLGITTNGEMLQLRIDSPNVVHILVTGQTGSGKSHLARAIIVSTAYNMSPAELELYLIDIKGSTFGPLEGLVHNNQDGVITSPDEGVLKLNQLVTEMELRDRTKRTTPMILLAIEEIADFISTHGDEVLKPLQRLLQRGREANIHVIVSTQKPLASVLGSLGRANLPTRVVGKVVSKKEARFATDIDGSGAENLAGKGDFLLIAGGAVERFQAFWFNREDLDAIIAKANQ